MRMERERGDAKEGLVPASAAARAGVARPASAAASAAPWIAAIGTLAAIGLALCRRSAALARHRADGEARRLAGEIHALRDAEQRRLASTLREKTVLRDEVNHRVKNNLQVITSLLSLQARIAPPAARAALAECRNRVHAMALTHQVLHDGADVARLHFGEYLSRLGRLLADAHHAEAPRVALRVEGAQTPLYLALPRAIPCGLLVNELVTHAYRHAFAADGAGTIAVGLAIEGEHARLWVADDGVPTAGGEPPGDDAPDPETPDPARPLAWQLVALLLEQIGGTLVRSRGPGTRLDVSFPVEDGARR